MQKPSESRSPLSDARHPAERPRGGTFKRFWEFVHRAAAHPDPLAQTSNWVALTIGSHLPFWPLYILWSAGEQAWPSSLLTVAMSPLFLAVPFVSRRCSLCGRVATPVLGIANTIFTIWVLGMNSGTQVFLAPCAALAAQLFRKNERWLMLGLTALPVAVWFLLQQHAPEPLHRYDPQAAHQMVILNVASIGVLVALFGWFQLDIYRRMEAPEGNAG